MQLQQQQQQQQQQVQLCSATQQGLKHWLQVSKASGADVWPELRAGSAADLENIVSRAISAGFGAHLEESSLQHYVRLQSWSYACS